jgi:hypothetical protein
MGKSSAEAGHPSLPGLLRCPENNAHGTAHGPILQAAPPHLAKYPVSVNFLLDKADIVLYHRRKVAKTLRIPRGGTWRLF